VRGDSFPDGFVCNVFFGTISDTFSDKDKSGVVGTVAADEEGLIAQSGGGDEINGRGLVAGISSIAIEFVKLLARISSTAK